MSKQFNFSCSALKQAKTDTEKLAALLLVAKACREVQLADSEKKILFKLIEPAFVLKLVLDLKETIDAGDEYQNKIYVLDVVTIFLSAFIEQDKQFWAPCFEALGHICLSLLAKEQPTSSDEALIGAIFICLGVLNSILDNNKNKELIEFLIDNYLKFVIGEKSKLNRNDQTFALIVNFAHALNNAHWNELMNKFSSSFRRDRSAAKFKICTLLKRIIAHGKHRSISVEQAWVKNVHEAIFEILQNRLDKNIRTDVFAICLELTMKCEHNVDWIKLNEWTESNSKFLILLLRLICIEVQVTIIEHLNRINSVDSISINITSTDSLCTAFLLLELLIDSFGEAIDFDETTQSSHFKINNNQIVISIEAITETMIKVVEFVRELYRLEGILTNESHPSYECFILGVHLICYYMKEETNFLKENIPSLGNIFKNVYERIKNDEKHAHTKQIIEDLFNLLPTLN